MNIEFKVPGKVMLNGAYLVLCGEPCTSIITDIYMNFSAEIVKGSGCIKMNIDHKSYNYTLRNSCWCHNNTHSDSDFFLRIFNEIFKTLDYDIFIQITLDDGFFTQKGSKTGIGSSSCLLVGLCYIAYRIECLKNSVEINKNNFYQYCMGIHHLINPGSSGYDTASCILGNIIYKMSQWSKYSPKEKYIILGTFDKSTSSREMIKKIKVDEKWDNLKEINISLINGEDSYENYIDELRNINAAIVPDRQYKILKKTFKLGIKKCGVSGAGGEDAIWALVDDPSQVFDAWTESMDYVKICKITSDGLLDASLN